MATALQLVVFGHDGYVCDILEWGSADQASSIRHYLTRIYCGTPRMNLCVVGAPERNIPLWPVVDAIPEGCKKLRPCVDVGGRYVDAVDFAVGVLNALEAGL